MILNSITIKKEDYIPLPILILKFLRLFVFFFVGIGDIISLMVVFDEPRIGKKKNFELACTYICHEKIFFFNKKSVLECNNGSDLMSPG